MTLLILIINFRDILYSVYCEMVCPLETVIPSHKIEAFVVLLKLPRTDNNLCQPIRMAITAIIKPYDILVKYELKDVAD